MRTELKAAVALTAVALLCGCATKPPTAREEVAVWLAEGPRAIAIGVDRELPQFVNHTRDHHAWIRIGLGAVRALQGAYSTVGRGCLGGVVGCVVGAILSPVGAVVGAMLRAGQVNSVDLYHPVDAAKGADALFELAGRSNLPTLLAEAIVAQQPQAGGHQFLIAESNSPE